MLPQLDSNFARAIERASTLDEYQKAIDRIERYATTAIASRVKRVYEMLTQQGSFGGEGPAATGIRALERAVAG